MMKRHSNNQVALFLSMIWLLASVSIASAEPSASDAESARSYMDEADRLRESGDLWAALERYQAADQLMHVPTTGLEVAKTQAALLQLTEARASALSVAHTPTQPREPKVFDAARKEAAQLAAALGPRIPDLKLSVEPATAQAVVTIDGRPMPRVSPELPYKVNPGRHLLVVEAPDFETKQEQVTLAEGEHRALTLTLLPSATQSSKAVVAVEPVKSAPARAVAEQAVDSGSSAGRTRAYIGFAAGGALLVTGAITGIMSLTKVSDVRSRCMNDVCPESARSDVATADTLGMIANITLPLGMLGVGYGVVELLLSGSDDRAPEPSIRAGLTPTGVGVSGRF
jgi:hypothetical protein